MHASNLYINYSAENTQKGEYIIILRGPIMIKHAKEKITRY